jgi:hypothetical protein
MTTAERLAALREAATPGPWMLSPLDEPGVIAGAGGADLGVLIATANMDRHRDGERDAQLIVALVNALPAIEALVAAAETPFVPKPVPERVSWTELRQQERADYGTLLVRLRAALASLDEALA